MTDPKQPPRGLLASLRGLLLTALSLAQTRLELLVAELEEERQRLLALVLWGAVAFMFLGVGLIFLAIFFTVLFWDSQRLLVLGIITALFIAGGVVAAIVVTRLCGRSSRLFKDSLGELVQDRVDLQRSSE